MRSLKSIYTIPAHKSSVSDVKFFHTSSSPLPTGSTPVPRGFAKLPALADDVRDPLEKDGEKVDMPLTGSFLVSSGYDGLIKVWSADDWQLIKSMTSDAAGKVMSADISPGEFLTARRRRELMGVADARFMASAEYSRTYKLWSSPNVDLE